MKTKYIKIAVLVALLAMLTSCTNWRAKFLESQHELEKARNPEETTLTEVKPVQLTPANAVKRDTIVINVPAETTHIGTTRVVKRLQKISFSAERAYFFNQDSLKVWITISNQLLGHMLFQRARLDSVRYPRRTTTTIRKVPVEVDKTNPYKAVAIGAITATVIILLFTFLRRRSA